MSELARVGDWLARWAERQRLPAELVFAMRLCLEEVLANIVMHAPAESDQNILVAGRCDAHNVVLTVEDDGDAFDPAAAAARQTSRPTDREIGGHGLILLARYASRLAYERDRGRNRLTLTFKAGD